MLPENVTSAQIKSSVDERLKFCQDKRVYTRPGLDGVFDLLSDTFLTEKIVSRNSTTNNEFDVDKYNEAYEGEDLVAQTLEKTIKSFRLEKIDLDQTDSLPQEIKYLLLAYPEVGPIIARLKEKGLDTRLQTLQKTPQNILDAITQISVISQENYTTSWLPQLVRDQQKPVLTPTANGLSRGKDMGLIKEDEPIDLEPAVGQILAISSEYKKIIALNPAQLSAEDQETIDKLNKGLNEFNLDYALKRLVFDNSDERTQESQETIKKMMVIGPVAHCLELANLGILAKVFTASADDLLGEWAEIQALAGAGYTKKEIISRLGVVVPVFALATAGAAQVERLLEEGRLAEAGALFGLAAVALSLTTAIQSIKMYKKGYDILVAEGKINTKNSPILANETFQENIETFEQGESLLDDNQQLTELISKGLDSLQATIEQNEKDVLMQNLNSVDNKNLSDNIKNLIQDPTQWNRWLEAIKQDFTNPARMGILLGSCLAPVAGGAAAVTGLMHNGFVMAGIGSVESMVGGLTVLTAEKLVEYRYAAFVKGKIEDLQKNQQANLVPSFEKSHS